MDSRYKFHSHAEVVRAARTLPELKSMARRDFVHWLQDNEKIYVAFRHFALAAVAKKRSRFSAYMIRERVRWYTNIEYGGRFKISNNVTPYVSRLLALDVPILDKIFAKKEINIEDFGPYTGDFFDHGRAEL